MMISSDCVSLQSEWFVASYSAIYANSRSLDCAVACAPATLGMTKLVRAASLALRPALRMTAVT